MTRRHVYHLFKELLKVALVMFVIAGIVYNASLCVLLSPRIKRQHLAHPIIKQNNAPTPRPIFIAGHAVDTVRHTLVVETKMQIFRANERSIFQKLRVRVFLGGFFEALINIPGLFIPRRLFSD
ncbi:hypothetical protein Zmor_008465 [Zophobas morio]|uniref:Uncharacterized protein n=1 Tax=Zophobas morio TaxID=2755281 RepID=A0AA38MQT1_9CUCU|nr:hypothetical protein Zmor_008465 [Zophobas morio]